MNYFIVFDFETDGVNPEVCNPVQLAAVPIDPYNLEILEDSAFVSDMRPDGIDEEDFLKDNKRVDTIKWHAKNQKCTFEEVIERWKKAPAKELVWKNFSQYINKYNNKKTQGNAPYAAGMNIKNFDLKIAERLNEEYGIKRMFNYEYTDIRDWAFHALIWDNDLKRRNMDTLRKYLGLSMDNAHDALQDVIQEAQVISRYLSFYKNMFDKIRYKGCMK